MAFSTTTTYQQSSSSAETYHWSSQMRHVPQEQQLEQLKQHERQSGLWAESCSIAPAFIVAHQTTSSLSQCTQYSHNIRTEQVYTFIFYFFYCFLLIVIFVFTGSLRVN